MTVETIQAAAYDNAIIAGNSATRFVDNAVQAVNSLANPLSANITRPAPVNTGLRYLNLENAVYSQLPSLGSLADFNGINAPNSPLIATFATPVIDAIPTFDMALPVINLPAAPSNILPAAPGAAPILATPVLPNRPTFTLPVAPTFTPVALPTEGNVEIPVFDAVADFGDIIAPTQNFEFREVEYTSAMLDATKAKILGDLMNGGYGIDDADERRLWDRARERELVNTQAKIEEVTRLHASRSFSLPPGALLAQIESAEQDALEKNSSLSRDIAIKRADLYVENRKFTITTAVQMEDILIRHAGTVAERSLNAARTTVELGISLFNTQVAKYNARLDAFRTYATAFESRVRAALAGVEIYKSRVESARLSVDVQKLYADVYNTQIGGVQALIGVYRTDMEAAQIAASIEQLKLESFRTQVSAYAEQVRAQVSTFEGFRAQIGGELAKVQIYEASVQAYTARLQGSEVQARVADIKSRTEIAQAGLKLDVYKTDIEAYRSQIAVVSEKIRAALAAYTGRLAGYNTFVGGLQAAAASEVQVSEAQARVDIGYQTLLLEDLKRQTEELTSIAGVIGQTNIGAASAEAQIASSWASSVTGLSAQII